MRPQGRLKPAGLFGGDWLRAPLVVILGEELDAIAADELAAIGGFVVAAGNRHVGAQDGHFNPPQITKSRAPSDRWAGRRGLGVRLAVPKRRSRQTTLVLTQAPVFSSATLRGAFLSLSSGSNCLPRSGTNHYN